MPQPLYSPILAPAEFFLFPTLKTLMKGKGFATIPVGDTKSAFQKCFEDWKNRWHKCIISEVGYFEADKIVIDK